MNDERGWNLQQRLEPGSIVTFSGAQGTGKTIMKEKLSEYLRSHYDYTIVNQLPGVKKSIMRDLADRGLPINQEATLESQEYACTVFISKFVELRNQMRESTNTVAVLDRSMYDCFPYLWLHYRGSIVSLNNIRMYHVMRHMHEIVPQQIIFSGVADGGELHDGEYRSIDKAF